jgi:hypothetical protein
MHELHYGFDDEWLYVRVDLFEEAKAELRDCVFRVAVRAAQEVKIQAHIRDGMLTDIQVETNEACLLGARQYVQVAYGQILEVAIARSVIETAGRNSIQLATSLWESGLPVDMLPSEGSLEIRLGAEFFAWPKT